MRLASLARDGWELRSAEADHARHPDTFWIPDVERRRALARGQGVKLLFAIATGGVEPLDVSSERMWVVVSDQVGDGFLGRLVNAPSSLEPGRKHYLQIGAEIPFGPEHIADIDDPPDAYVEPLLNAPPARRWPRSEKP